MTKSLNKKVAIGMSGGVDSSTTAVLLKEQGYDVIGITALMNKTPDVSKKAKEVCDKFGIEHYVIDLSEKFEKEVIDYFKNSYKNGLTPNPCIACNKKIKWGVLYDYAINTLGTDYFATGHYANIAQNKDGYFLTKAKDTQKDQLYFLFELTQEQLSKTIFPMGDFDKTQVREIAQKYDIPTKNSKDSQDICFIPNPDTTKKFLLREFGKKEGYFIDINTNKVLGKHNGYYQFTIGQRKGIGISAPNPLYVVDVDPLKNSVIVGYKENLYKSSLEIVSPTFQQKSYVGKEFRALTKIRYNSKPAHSLIIPNNTNNSIQIIFDEPQSAITKGQAAVIYSPDGSSLIGGGWIK
ncbi:MAG: tRNA 2-thiouridine(34) synthase MnmA [Candidatus Gastranaerophilales bacterium]|nr:tRNA 2-thiouridine(34) synthase MnmA [Candidatus Gastranaerophilales bacterium]